MPVANKPVEMALEGVSGAPVLASDIPRPMEGMEENRVWQRMYAHALRKFEAASYESRGHRYTKGRRWGVDVKAAIVADYMVWRSVPRSERPADWPRTRVEFARRYGTMPMEVNRLARVAGAERILARGMLTKGEQTRLLDMMLFDVIEGMDADSKNLPALMKLAYSRLGALRSTEGSVNIGTRNTLNVVMQGDGDLRQRMERWLSEKERLKAREVSGVEVEGGEVPGAAVEVLPGPDRGDPADDGPEHAGDRRVP